jgi:hypothetical protein
MGWGSVKKYSHYFGGGYFTDEEVVLIGEGAFAVWFPYYGRPTWKKQQWIGFAKFHIFGWTP